MRYNYEVKCDKIPRIAIHRRLCYPNIYVSYKVAEAVGDKADYLRNKGLDDEVCIQLIISVLKHGTSSTSKHELYESLKNALPGISEDKKSKKLSNLLQKMRREGIIDNTGRTLGAKWYLKKID